MTTEPPKARRTVAFVGNCQANSLAKIYRRRIAPLLGDQVIHVAALPEQSSDDLSQALAQLAQADVIAEQKFDTPDPIPAEFFDRPGIRRIRFPNLSGRLYWPYSGAAHPNTPRGQENGTTIPYPKGLGDAFLNKMIADRVPPREALRRYDDQVAGNATRIARMAELHLERQAARDAECDMNFAEYVAAAYRREPVYSAQGHPGLELSRMLITAVFDALEVPRLLINEATQWLEAAPFPPTEMPFHPGVAQILGLAFGAADQRYLFYEEGYFTFEEFAIRYMDYTWSPDMVAATTLLLDANFTAGIPKMREALQQCPGTSTAWHLLGFALLRTQQLEAAEIAIRQAMRLGRPYPNSFVVLADVLMQRGDVEGADAVLKDAFARFPSHAGVQNAQARLLAQRGRHEEAVAISRLVAGRDPADVTALLTLSRHLRLAEAGVHDRD